MVVDGGLNGLKADSGILADSHQARRDVGGKGAATRIQARELEDDVAVFDAGADQKRSAAQLLQPVRDAGEQLLKRLKEFVGAALDARGGRRELVNDLHLGAIRVFALDLDCAMNH